MIARFSIAALLIAIVCAGQNWKPPRTPDGQPDLQGVWTNGFITPVERLPELTCKPFFTKEEALAFEQHKVINRDSRSKLDSESDVKFAYNDAWWDSGTKVIRTLRTSIIFDPSDGKMPPMSSVTTTRCIQSWSKAVPNRKSGASNAHLRSATSWTSCSRI